MKKPDQIFYEHYDGLIDEGILWQAIVPAMEAYAAQFPHPVEGQEVYRWDELVEKIKPAIGTYDNDLVSGIANRVIGVLKKELSVSTSTDFRKLVTDYFRFDNDQQPLSSWHEREELIKALEERITLPLPVGGEVVDKGEFTKEDLFAVMNMSYHHGLNATGIDAKIKNKILSQLKNMKDAEK